MTNPSDRHQPDRPTNPAQWNPDRFESVRIMKRTFCLQWQRQKNVKAGLVLTIGVVGAAIGLQLVNAMQPKKPPTPDEVMAVIVRDRESGKLSEAEAYRKERELICAQTSTAGASEWDVRRWVEISLGDGDRASASRQFAFDAKLGAIELSCPWKD